MCFVCYAINAEKSDHGLFSIVLCEMCGKAQKTSPSVKLLSSVHYSEAKLVSTKFFCCLQSLPEFLPEQASRPTGSRPAQVSLLLHEFPQAVVRRQLTGRDLLQKHQDQHILLLIEQTETRQRKMRNLQSASLSLRKLIQKLSTESEEHLPFKGKLSHNAKKSKLVFPDVFLSGVVPEECSVVKSLYIC